MAFLRRLLCFVLLCCWSGAWAQTTVSGFSPEGQVRRVRQATARFSQPMVAFGDLRADTPFEVDCAVPGSGRWVDARTWSYDFERDLPGAVRTAASRCKPDVARSGRPAAGGHARIRVGTGGPAVLESRPGEGASGIDERQAFVLALSAPGEREHRQAQAWCRADGISDKIGVRLLHGEQREQVLRADRWFVRQIVAEDRGKEAARPYTDARLRADDKAGRWPASSCCNAGARCRPIPTWPSSGARASPRRTAPPRRRPDAGLQDAPRFQLSLRCERVNARGCSAFPSCRCAWTSARPCAWRMRAKIYLEGRRQARSGRARQGCGQSGDRSARSACPAPSRNRRA
jgi:hypothetical protein